MNHEQAPDWVLMLHIISSLAGFWTGRQDRTSQGCRHMHQFSRPERVAPPLPARTVPLSAVQGGRTACAHCSSGVQQYSAAARLPGTRGSSSARIDPQAHVTADVWLSLSMHPMPDACIASLLGSQPLVALRSRLAHDTAGIRASASPPYQHAAALPLAPPAPCIETIAGVKRSSIPAGNQMRLAETSLLVAVVNRSLTMPES